MWIARRVCFHALFISGTCVSFQHFAGVWMLKMTPWYREKRQNILFFRLNAADSYQVGSGVGKVGFLRFYHVEFILRLFVIIESEIVIQSIKYIIYYRRHVLCMYLHSIYSIYSIVCHHWIRNRNRVFSYIFLRMRTEADALLATWSLASQSLTTDHQLCLRYDYGDKHKI